MSIVVNRFTYDLEEGKKAVERTVKVDLRVHPLSASGVQTRCLVRDNFVGIFIAICVDALPELPSKQLVAHDTEYQPENHTNDQNISDRGHGMNKGVHHDLQIQNSKMFSTY